MASGDLSLTSNSSQDESPEYVGFTADRTLLRPSSNSSGSTTANISNNNPTKKYEKVKQQYDQAVIELSNMRRQHGDTMRRCEEMASQLGFYQDQYMAAMNQLETSAKERSKYTDVSNENARLQQQNLHLERKLRRCLESMKQQEKDNGNPSGGFTPFFEHYPEMGNKKCDGGCMETEKMHEEVQMCKKLYSELSKERNAIAVEKDKLRLQLSAAFTELENVKREKNIFRDARDQLIMQQDKEMEEMKALMTSRANELLMTKIDRNRVEEELNQILSEKDNVLQETQKMSDDLSAVRKELEGKKKDETRLRGEIKSLQQNYDELMQKMQQLNMKIEKRELLKSRESNWSKEFSESKDDFKEIEKLRKSLEKAKTEVDKAVQETEVAKNRRDWAISEREKIVQERDSVKTLCDELRKERDKAISDWLSAIRDSEKIKKQKDEACKEIETLREQLESQATSTRRSFRWSSAPFDFDELVEIEINNICQEQDVGIILDDINNRQLVCGVTNMSPAFGKLKINDVIVKVNELDCHSISKRIVLDAIRTSAPRCKLLISRTKQSYGDVKRRMTNTSAQTDSNDSVHRAIAAKQTSKISEMINKFKEKIHISKSGTDPDNLSQENEALSALDSVLSENTDKSKENLFKRSKRGKKESSREANKSMGTWPRAAILNTSQENPTGTIVQHRKKERPTLSVFTGPINVDKDAAEHYFKPVMTSSQSQQSKLSQPSHSNGNSTKNNPNRNSNPIPTHLFTQGNTTNSYLHRHSVYATPLESEPVLLEHIKPSNKTPTNVNMRIKMPPDSSSKYVTSHRHQNRFSLNLMPSDNSLIFKSSGQSAQQQFQQQSSMDFIPKKQFIDSLLNPSKMGFPTSGSSSAHQGGPYAGGNQQNSLDVISLKSQNSIDSFLSQKSPPMHDYGYTKRTMHQQKNVSKYPSDSESIGVAELMSHSHHGQSSSGGGGGAGALPPTSLLFAPPITWPSSRNSPIYPSFPGHIHPHPHRIRHSSPLTIPNATASMEHHSGSGAAAMSSSDKLEMDYHSNHHAYNVSFDYPYNRGRAQPTRDHDDPPSSFVNVYEGGTFPRKKEHQRFRIPSNPSVTSKGSGVKNSTGSIEHHGSERGSPMPPVHVEILSHGANKRNSNVPDFLCPGDLRRVTIDKSDKPLGITIQCNNNGGGIFVSTVAEKSIASRAGLQIGDQLLEVCGINMRSATNDIAANVLRQCGNSITMLVQYNPEKYDAHAAEPENMNHSGSPTPRNSPRPPRTAVVPSTPQTQSLLNVPKPISSQTSALISSHKKKQKFSDSLENQSDSTSPQCSVESIFEEEPRLITLHAEKCKNLGIKLFGGNKVGIFVHDVQSDSAADLAGIRKGDQILEYNGVDLRRVTAEQAANEISKLTDSVTLLVQNNLQKLNHIQDKAGDSFYIRVGFDRAGELGEGELRFSKDEVLYVDNTIFRGVFGQWRAWKLDAYGHRKECGIIPSQSKVEEELRLLGDSTDGEGGTTRRGTTLTRRSFFRRKKHQRSSSRDSKELASFSNTQLSYFSDSGMLNDEGVLLSYQRVERLDYPVCRPILVLGPLAEWVTDRLTIDFPQLFQHCIMTQMNCSQEAMDEGLQKNIFVDYRRKGSIFECTTVQSIRNICENNRYCILDICISAVERLQRLQIYPIVLLLRFKSAKQIKEIKDSRYSTDKISAKAAKEMYDRALKLETDYKQFISAVIPAGVNITHMSTQIKASVVEEQSRVLWVPATSC